MAQNGLTATFQELMEHRREAEWRKAGVPEHDIVFSRSCGMDARDVRVFREVSARDLIIVVRCPKVAARPWHGVLPPKPMAAKEKSGSSGVLVKEGRGAYVSDYDLMGVWRGTPGSFSRIVMSAPGGAPRGKWTPEATELARLLNKRLVSRIQHGCQDDFDSADNPGVKKGDHFAAFKLGISTHLVDIAACAKYYAENGLDWPYDADGKYARTA